MATGIVVSVVGLPYNGPGDDAFAELYHGPVDTTGTVHVAIDCDIFTITTDLHCHRVPFGPPLSIGVTIGNSTGSDLDIVAFNFKVTNQPSGSVQSQCWLGHES